MRRQLLPWLAACALVATPWSEALAQRVAGSGQDAIVLPRGVLRVSIFGVFDDADERFSSATDGSPIGTARPFGAPYSAAAFGSAQVEGLGALQARLRTLTGLSGLELSLGTLDVHASAQRVTVPVLLELGVGRRLQLTTMVPYVRTRTLAELRANPTGLEGNVGINPTYAGTEAAATNAALVMQLRGAADALDAALVGCAGGGTTAACADPVTAALTRDAARALANDVSELFGTAQQTGSRLVPAIGTPAANAIAMRLQSLRSGFEGFGVTTIAPGAAPALAPSAPTGPQLQQLLATGLALDLAPIADVSRYGIGDVEVGLRLQLIDPFGGDARAATTPSGTNLRLAVGALARLGTGRTEDPAHPVDIGVGDGQHDVEVNGTGDLLIGGRFWLSATGRYGVQLPHEGLRRVPASAGEVFLPAASERLLRRDPGDYMVLEVVPRYALASIISIDGHYTYRRKAADRFTLVGGDAAGVNPSLLELDTEGYQHQAGLGVTISTVGAWARGGARAPLDLSFLHLRTVAGGGGEVLRTHRDQVMLRIYLSLFGQR